MRDRNNQFAAVPIKRPVGILYPIVQNSNWSEYISHNEN